MLKRNIFAALDPVFHPRSVALIGASGKLGKTGRVLAERFLEKGFRELYPVNPRETDILGVRAFRAMTKIPGPGDQPIVLTPTGAALAAVKEWAAKGVKAIVITTSGFVKVGEKERGATSRPYLEATEHVKTRKLLAATAMSGTTQSVAQHFPLFLGSGIRLYSDAAMASRALAQGRVWSIRTSAMGRRLWLHSRAS